MNSFNYTAGIDVDKKTFKVCLLACGQDKSRKIKGSRTFDNTRKGAREFVGWIGRQLKCASGEERYVLEATGVYHELLAHLLFEEGKTVHVVLPLRAKRYLQSLGIRSKTDKIDARGLAVMGSEQQLEPWAPASPRLMELRSLTRQVEALQKSKTSFLNQLEGAVHAVTVHLEVIKSLKAMIKQLEKQIARLEAQIKAVVEEDETLHGKFKLLHELKGVGIMTFAVVAAETNGFALFKNQRQLVCFAGYDVVENQSGNRVGKTRISKKGNSHIRRILHMASLSVINARVQPFTNLKERVHGRSGVKMKGYVAVQRKLLVMLYTLWKKDENFAPEYQGQKTSGIHEPEVFFSDEGH